MLPAKIIFGVLALCLLPASSFAADSPAQFTDSQKAAIEELVRNLLIKKEPEIIMKAAQEIQNRQEAEASVKNQQAVAVNREKLLNDPNSPVGGNLKGAVTIVEFIDYQCGYCKLSYEAVEKLLSENKDVKIIYKEFPILGPASVQAAKASLASARQGKFHKFHKALMPVKEHLSDEVIFKTAKEAGLNVDKLKKDMADPAIEKMIKESLELGNEVGAHGTPTFIIGETVHPGMMQYEELKKAVEEARQASGARK